MIGVLTARRLAQGRRQSGLSLIEIVAALFVVLLGVLGVFAVIPVAMTRLMIRRLARHSQPSGP